MGFLLVGTGVCLGIGLPLSKAAGHAGVSPMAFAAWPTLIAAVAMTGWALWRHGRPAASGRLVVYGLIAGLLGQALPSALSFWLSTRAGASYASFSYTMPSIFTLALSMAAGLERFRLVRVLGVLAGFGGALLLAGSVPSGLDGTAALLAVGALFAIPLALGAGNIYRKIALPTGVPNEWLGAATLAGAALWLLPLPFLEASGTGAVVHAFAIGLMAAQTAALVAGFILYFALQIRADPVIFSFMGYVVTLTALLAGALVFGETIPLRALPAAALIGIGLWMTARRTTQDSPSEFIAARAGRDAPERHRRVR